MAPTKHDLYLFGGYTPWSPEQWVAQDDRVRGGSSQSYLDCSSTSTTAVFHGNLNITTLGGAGFASQRTTDTKSWNLADYRGLALKIDKSDGKKYTLTLKDEMPSKRPDDREQSTISWEYDFVCDKDNGELFIPWKDFKPTYRGKAKPDAEPLDLESIRRISFMMRSFFGDQEGPFRLEIEYLAATATEDRMVYVRTRSQGSSTASFADQEKAPNTVQLPKGSWLDWLCGMFRYNNQ